MRKVRFFCITLIVSSAFTVSPAWGQKKTKDLLDELGYPELQVTPLASERLTSEARKEKRNRWTTQLPIMVSGALLLAAGSTAEEDGFLNKMDQDDFDTGTITAQLLGGAWLLTGAALAVFYKPYRKGRRSISKMPKGTKRERLARERAAEEALYKPANNAWMLQWFPFVTNMAGALTLQDSNIDDDSKSFAMLAAVGALAPVLFPHRWQRVRSKHKEYKKKIFGPVASSAMVLSPDRKSILPGINLSWTF